MFVVEIKIISATWIYEKRKIWIRVVDTTKKRC